MKKTRKVKGQKQPKKVLRSTTSENSPDEPSEKPLDFGGIPDRDLKKNLGCG